MKRNLRLLLVIVVSATLITCVAKAPLNRRWADSKKPITISDSNDQKDPAIPQLWVAAVSPESGTQIKPKDLTDRAEASYFEQLAKFSKTCSEFITFSGLPLGSNEKKIDTTSFARILVITVSKGQYRPGERIVRSRVTITPENFYFTNYTIAATEYSNINIDSVTSTQTVGLGAELSPTLSGTIAGTSKLSASYSNAVVDTALFSQRIEQLTVSIKDNSLIVYRESERGLDLTGNTLIKLSLQVKNPDDDSLVDNCMIVNSTKLKNEQGLLCPSQASISFISASITIPDDFVADASLEYVKRVILDGESTYTESDDRIMWVVNPLPAPTTKFILIPKSEMAVPRWKVVTPDLKQILLVRVLNRNQQLYFTDFDLAQEFLGWLKQMHAVEVGGLRLLIAQVSDTAHPTELTLDSCPDFILMRAD